MWQFSLRGTYADVRKRLEGEVNKAKTGCTIREVEHIDAAVQLFNHMVPRNSRDDLHVHFSAVGDDSDKIAFSSSLGTYSFQTE